MWNPELDENALLQDFYDKAFSPASDEMKKYFDLQDNPPPMSAGVVGQLFRRLQGAPDAAKGNEAVMKRLDHIAGYLRYYDLNYRVGAPAAPEIATLMYRNRYAYMNHWEAYRQDVIKEDYNPTGPKPWKVDKPITREEIEGWMQEGLKSYLEFVIPLQTTFSDDLVAVNLGGKGVTWGSGTMQAGSPTWPVYSVKGEPIKVRIVSYNIYGGTKLSYELRDAKGKVIGRGEPVGTGDDGKGKSGTNTEISKIPLPGPGRYNLNYTDGSGSMYAIVIESEQHFAFDYKTIASSTLYGATPDLYFYVPKRVKSIEYYFSRTDWSNSGPHSVVDPNGKVQATYDVGHGYQSVPVPAGLDGKAWHFTSPAAGGQFGLGRFHFFNCPDLLSPSPTQLLVPREVAVKDGLKILK